MLSYIKIKPVLVQFVPLAPRALYVAPCEEGTSSSLQPPVRYWNTGMRCPLSFLFSMEERQIMIIFCFCTVLIPNLNTVISNCKHNNDTKLDCIYQEIPFVKWYHEFLPQAMFEISLCYRLHCTFLWLRQWQSCTATCLLYLISTFSRVWKWVWTPLGKEWLVTRFLFLRLLKNKYIPLIPLAKDTRNSGLLSSCVSTAERIQSGETSILFAFRVFAFHVCLKVCWE